MYIVRSQQVSIIFVIVINFSCLTTTIPMMRPNGRTGQRAERAPSTTKPQISRCRLNMDMAFVRTEEFCRCSAVNVAFCHCHKEVKPVLP